MDNIFFNSLKEQYYTQVPFALKKNAIEQAVKAFMTFLDAPDEIKHHIAFKLPPLQRRGEVGFYHRDPDDGSYRDSKDFFHFHPSIFARYEAFLKEHAVVRDFMQHAMIIWEEAYKTVHTVLNTFETAFPGTVAKVFDTENVRIFLRFLKYNWATSGKYLAKPHFDAGSFTLAIAESGPGLRIGSCPDDLKLVDHQEEKAIFMLSSVFDKVIQTDLFSPGWHDVIQLDENIIGKPFARWAVVAFVEAPGVENLPRDETHKFYAEIMS